MIPLPHIVDIGAGRPIVFLHGWSARADFFAPQQALAGADIRFIAPDLPGHGRNQCPGVPLTIGNLADALAGMLATLDLAGAVLVGWSMGASVALDCLARHGAARAAGLVVVDMTAKVANDAQWTLGLRGGPTADDMMRAAVRMETHWTSYVERITPLMFAPSMRRDDPIYQRAAAAVAANDGATMAGLWRSLAAADHRETIRRLDLPVLAIGGAQSQLYGPEVARWIARHARNGRALSIAGAGHAPQLEAPDAFNAAVRAFVDALR